MVGRPLWTPFNCLEPILIISSRTNPKIKLVKKLQQDKRTRSKERLFVVEGTRWIQELLISEQQPEMWFASDAWLAEEPDIAKALTGLSQGPLIVDESILKEISDTASPSGVVAVLSWTNLSWPEQPDFLLLLDQIRDPGNLGTLIRTATAAGANGVLLMPNCVDRFNPKVVRSTMGSMLRIPIMQADWQSYRAAIGQCHLYVADLDLENGLPYTSVDWAKPSGIIVGGEANGPSNAARSAADQVAYIPMHGNVESLNAAVAGSIMLFEAARQRDA